MSGFYQRALAAKGDYGTLALDKALTEELLGILRRDWAVRVLDAWAPQGYLVEHKLAANYGELFRVSGSPSSVGWDRSRDAARLAAAEAVWPELPESVRAELGERP